MISVRVEPSDATWVVRLAGESAPRERFGLRVNAEAAARELAHSTGAELIVLDTDGEVSSRESFAR